MYSWGDGIDDWARPGAYKFAEARKAARDAFAKKAEARGERAYQSKRHPNEGLTDPKKTIRTKSKNPLVVAIDVTGSMAGWPRELFDRLPLLYQTLSQYREDLEVSFVAIGDARCDRYPLQVTDFSKGFDLEDQAQALYGEGGGGDAPESYQLFAHYALNRIEVPDDTEGGKPFLIVFGDARFHAKLLPAELEKVTGDQIAKPLDGVKLWSQVGKRWNTFFLRRPTGAPGDGVHTQWAKALGDERVVYVADEQRGMDYAMGIVARAWGHFDDFAQNMSARQEDGKIAEVRNSVLSLDSELRVPTKRRRGRKGKPKKASSRRSPLVPKTRKR